MATTATTTSSLNKVETAHHMYRDGRYDEALGFYTDALAMAKNKAQKIALHSNRAACYLKLHDFKKATDECTSVLELDHKHTGALMLRAQTLVTLREYQSALFDVNRLLELNPSSEVYLNLQARLKTQLSLAPIPESEAELEEEEEDTYEVKAGKNKGLKGPKEQSVEHTFIRTEKKTVPEKEASDNGTHKPVTDNNKGSTEHHSKGWQAIPKPQGHSKLDYSRWDNVEDCSTEEDDDDNSDDESQPRYWFRVKTVGVRPVK